MRRRWTWTVAAAPLIVVFALMAGCSGGSRGNNSATPGASGSATASAPDNSLSATATVLALTPTVTPMPGTSGQQGLAEFCAQSPSVAVQLPASIPAYPNAQLRVSQTSGAFGLYGLCTKDSVSAVANYYASQLPAKGWRQVQSNTIQTVQQLSASQGNAQVVVTIEPDAQLGGTVQIIIQTSGVSG